MTAERPADFMRTNVGVDANLFGTSMTGVGNYCFHLLKAMMNAQPRMEFIGFSNTWQPLTLQYLNEFELAYGKGGFEEEQSSGPVDVGRVVNHFRKYVGRGSVARRTYRHVLKRRFQNVPSTLRLFHCFRYLPMWELALPILPVVYDLSFIRYPDTHPKERLQELESLPDVIARSPIIQTISQFTKAEIVEAFGCSPEKIIVAPPAASHMFHPLGQQRTEKALSELRLSYRQYFLAVGTLEPRKNLRTLIAAYSRLSQSSQDRYPLIIVGHKGWGNLDLPSETERLVRNGVVRFFDSISDFRLRSMYEGALALLYPSLYEGFGMPVVEAFACGTDVAHSSNSAMDEVTEGLAHRVGAEDVDGWTDVMRQLIADPSAVLFRQNERINRARTFSWKSSAEIVLEAYSDRCWL
jgi:glycosyltransferase involved in cell wall biosynthesis